MQNQEMNKSQDFQEAGTGFMTSLSEAIHHFQAKGYTENLIAKFDHFEARSGEIRLEPDQITVDKIFRFENTSDPDDQAILYAISAPDLGIKGLYSESYGLYHEEMSPALLNKLKDHIH